MPKGKRDYISSKEKVSKGDLEHLKVGLQNAKSPCHLVEILQDTKCEPCQFNVNDLPSRQRITNAEDVVTKLDETAVRSSILENLTDVLDTAIIPDVEKCKKFVQQNLLVDNDMCRDIEKNTRKQNECEEWYQQRKCRLTASLFGCVMKRRKSIYPKSIVEKIQKPTKVCTARLQVGH